MSLGQRPRPAIQNMGARAAFATRFAPGVAGSGVLGLATFARGIVRARLRFCVVRFRGVVLAFLFSACLTTSKIWALVAPTARKTSLLALAFSLRRSSHAVSLGLSSFSFFAIVTAGRSKPACAGDLKRMETSVEVPEHSMGGGRGANEGTAGGGGGGAQVLKC